MKIRFADIWRPSGTIDRGTYAVVGVVGFALKHNLDRLVASYFFHRQWGFFNYWVPIRDVARITDLHSRDTVFLETMMVLALPFVWVGVAMTLKRLRSAGLAPSLVALFFIPFLNLGFFLLLCLIPDRGISQPDQKTPRMPSVAQVIPDSALGSAGLALLVTVPVGVGLAVLGAQILMNYGWGLFVALPFAMGLAAALIYGARKPRTLGGCVGVACLSVLLLGLAIFAVAVEGLFCLIMAVPIAVPLAAFGGACGYLAQRRRQFHEAAPAMLSALLLFVPGVQWAEHVAARQSSVFTVRSAVDIKAPPEEVWKQVVAFTEIPPPTEWIFRAGIAYPIRAEMMGKGVGAERHCVFSTGAFVEPIEVWDEPRLLKFSVYANPPAMEEWTPYAQVQPAHLRGFFTSTGGQFLLTPLPNGGTHVEGTTWYRHRLWPEVYWRLWSDALLHQIHMRVLRHIREEAEKAAQSNTVGRAATGAN